MSFLSNLLEAGFDGTIEAGQALGRGADDLVHGDYGSFENEGENTFNHLADIPGTDFSTLRALYDGANGDLSWNPYDQNESVWDAAAGGRAGEDPKNRRWGRTIGTLVGSYFTGGLLGNLLGSSAGGGAASGALWGGGAAAGQGGDRDEIGKAAIRGGVSGGAGSYIEGLDTAGNLGVSNPAYRNVLNKTISGGLTTAMTPGADRSDIARGAAYSGVQGIGPMIFSSNNDANPYAMDYDSTTKSLAPTNQSQAPWANNNPNSVTSLSGMSYPTSTPVNGGYGGGSGVLDQQQGPSPLDRVSEILGNFGVNSNNMGSIAEGLAGLYQANRQRKQAKDLMSMVGGRRDAYGTQLRRNLERRDAAAGRRSDYGGRETQLQAALAELDSRNAPGMMQLSNLESLSRLGMLQSGLRTGSKLGWFNTPQSLSQLRMPQMPQMQMPDVYQPQTQIDPMNWDRQRRLDQFGG